MGVTAESSFPQGYEVFVTNILPKARVVPAAPVLSHLRMLKEPAEVECLKTAGRETLPSGEGREGV